ncbi:MAG: S8 family serine peptidase [Lewinellaceae bacterium]|nr:S8 family serine peptidase [Lewinellaceae bacterium]
MKYSRISLLVLHIFLGLAPCFSQNGTHVPGQLLVALHTDLSPGGLTRRMQEEISVAASVEKKVSTLLNTWLLALDPAAESGALAWLYRQPEVRMAQYNHVLEYRGSLLPDDPLFPQQWQYINTGANGGVPNADLDAELAWNIATGGLTPAGDTIVVAVIDGGVDKNHSELTANLWKNRGETPNDNIDNDNNGFPDDFQGWNVFADNDNIGGAGTGHGTPVSAIIGAKGNNTNGVAGINWNVKIMFVAGGSNESNILASYDYVLQARKRYNASNGATGAFVVAVNCSWGTDYGQASDAPLWCAAFDSLGAAGILSVAATANIPVNVDEVGDLPTTCPNDYLISVTNLTRADQKAALAAWGATQIDLGAYGQEVFTASANNGYGAHSGTSFAAPQVAGALGLLYSAPCPNLITIAKTNPGAAALLAKNLVLNSAVPNAAMQDITLTGGRLNLFSMLAEYEDQCSPCPPPFAVFVNEIKSHSARVHWSEIPVFQEVGLRWRAAGTTAWQLLSDVSDSYILDNLNACTSYEISLSASCGLAGSSDWSAPVIFKTDGCCEPPASVWMNWTNNTAAEVAWSGVTAATGYRLRVRPDGGNWQIIDWNETSFTLTGLTPCTSYEAQVQTLCDTGATTFSNLISFKTFGCGSCIDASYCTAKATHADDEWIAYISIGDWNAGSGPDGDGYENFTGGQSPLLTLSPQSTENVTITPGFSGLPYKEYFRIYVDFNMDGDFTDAGELAFNPALATDGPASGTLVTPVFSASGLSRMRIMMKYKGSNNLPPLPCETFEFGQVEDYCVELAGLISTGEANQKERTLRIYPQPAAAWVDVKLPEHTTGSAAVRVWDVTGRDLFSGTMILPANGTIRLNTADWPTGVYVVHVQQPEVLFRGVILKN